jgi:hypothetical protein
MPAACATVRDRLAEHAVGVLSERDRRAVERHLEWCAACRKEADELSGAAATLAYALDPAPLPDGLLTRVLTQVARVVRAPSFRRRTRAAASVAIAAMVAISALGWGAVMAGRAERFEVRADREAQQRTQDLRRFRVLLRQVEGQLGISLPADDARLVRLAPVGRRSGGGAALQFVSLSMRDFVMLHVSGLPPDGSGLPYRVWLVDPDGHAIRAGRVTTLDANGGGEVFHEFDIDLSPYTAVVVRDVAGRVALRGTVENQTA